MSDTRFDLVHQEDCDDELMSEFRHIASKLANGCGDYRREIARCYEEIDRLTAERDHFRVLSEACRPSGNDSPAPVPTWTPPANFADGEYEIDRAGALLPGRVWVGDEVLCVLSRGLYEKPALGCWRVESGMGIYLGSNQEAPQ